MWQSLRQYLEPYLQDLPALMPYILVGIGLLLLLILARVLVILWARKRVSAPDEAADKQEEEGGGGAGPQRGLSGLQTAFSEAMRRLRRLMKRRGRHVNWFVRLTGHRYRYEVPWYALVGEEQSGKTTLLRSLDFEKPVEPVVTQNETGEGNCNWWFFNQALFLDVAGRFVHRPSGRQASDEGWQQTLKQLRKYRPRQPLNGVVLTISCADLIGDERLEPAEIEDKAARMHTKLQQMQQQLGLRLPIYVVLTKCDAIPGFDAFCEELSPDRKQEMMGWSNPHAVDAAYTSDWVDECFATLERDLHYAQIQALGDNFKMSGQTVYETADTDTFFLFPNQVQRLKENLQLYLDELFQQSAYQGAHFFRGVYFTGDEEASAAGAMPEGETVQGTSSGGNKSREPVFLEELFREKVFQEWKLVRPLESAVSWQQWATQAMQWTVATLVFLGIFGLWYTGDELQERRYSILPSLRDAKESIQEVEKGGAGRHRMPWTGSLNRTWGGNWRLRV
jgi:type VI secretion system protein ImpL